MMSKRIDPAAASIIMATGIFLYGGVQAFPFIDRYLGEFLAFLLFVAWISIYSRLSFQFFQKDFLKPFLNDPIQSFAIGTWIAGVSVLCNVLLKYFPGTLPFLQVMSTINIILWGIFLITMIKSFSKLVKWPSKQIHGIILLSTVGTQSIVILLNNLYSFIPIVITEALVILGLVFYVLGVYLLVKRYVSTEWTLVDDWKNTNCIIHGALSITGLAVVTSNLFTTNDMIYFWFFVLGLLVVVESLEVLRAYKRIKNYGFRRGVWIYHTSQWSRNFTFGMFFAYSLALTVNSNYDLPTWFIQFQHLLLSFWAYVVLISLIVEIWLFVDYKVKSKHVAY